MNTVTQEKETPFEMRQEAKPDPRPDRYPKPDKPAHAGDAAAILERVGELAERAGVEVPALTEGLEAIGRAGRFVAELRARSESPDAMTKRLARQLVAGDIDIDDAIAETHAAEALAPGGRVARAIRITPDLAATHAFAAVGAQLDQAALLDQARAVVTDVLAEVHKLRPLLAGIRNADQATGAGAQKAAAWANYTSDLLPRYHAVQKLVGLLRQLGWLAPLPLGYADYATHARPDLARADRVAARRGNRPILELLDEACDAWEPDGAPFTEEQAVENARALGDEPELVRQPDDIRATSTPNGKYGN